MDSSQQLGQLLQSLADKAPDALDNYARALLADAAARYPYFAVPALALLRDGRTENDTDALRQRLALTASSQRTLAFAAYGDKWPCRSRAAAPGHHRRNRYLPPHLRLVHARRRSAD